MSIERVTHPLLDVLEVLLEEDQEKAELYGWLIIQKTGRAGPTVYRVLERLEQSGWVTGRWEDHEPGRPPRRMYRLTAAGAVDAAGLLRERRPRGEG
ncbi:PadR family transcriptional regulator [Actinomadura geliboluensis]|uniref:PadR family transcriptional regulator n=1 Tax=Actinomadura geliboluensis TaxID=882440 RepID=UPI00371A8F46